MIHILYFAQGHVEIFDLGFFFIVGQFRKAPIAFCHTNVNLKPLFGSIEWSRTKFLRCTFFRKIIHFIKFTNLDYS